MSPLHAVYRLPKPGLGPRGLIRLHEPIPTPATHEVLVRIHAVALHYRDTLLLNGNYPVPVKENVVPGCDMAGEVVAVGAGAAEFQPGDRVVTCPSPPGSGGLRKDSLGATLDGTLQEYRVFRDTDLVRAPDQLTYEDASTFPGAGLTAWNALYGGVPLRPGQIVLLQGTGGVSVFGLGIANAVGAKIIVTSSSDEKLEIARKLGATHTINYRTTPDWDNAVHEFTNGAGVDHILDTVGINEIERCFKALAFGGIITNIGFLGGTPIAAPNIPMLNIMKAATLRGIVGSGSKQQLKDLFQWGKASGYRPYIDKVFEFDQLTDALEYLGRGQHIGKVVVRVTPS